MGVFPPTAATLGKEFLEFHFSLIFLHFCVVFPNTKAKMPPKKADNKPSKKTEQKKKEKVIEDKTFGLKNKKGNKNQKYIAQVEKQVKSGGDPRAKKIE